MPAVRLAVIFLLALASLAAAQSSPVPRGSFQRITFKESSPLSSNQAQNKRWKIPIDAVNFYKIEDESFRIFVPDAFEDEEQDARPFGILFWISNTDEGMPDDDLQDLLRDHHLICIGANNSGTQRATAVRIGLALDAVHNLKKMFAIDENRVYAMGVSSGGKPASMLPIIYPEVFTGAVPICGVVYFRAIPEGKRPKYSWPARYDRPPTAILDRAKKNRFVLITGTDDVNRESVSQTYRLGFLKDNFKNVLYSEVEGMGHTMPEAKWLEQAIEFLDAPPALAKKGKAK